MLLVENTVRGLGGSYESLFVTASSLDRTRFEPVVLFFQANHFVERLRTLGISVIIARSRQFWEQASYIEKSARIRASLPRRGWLGTVRRRSVALVRAIVGGIPMAWTVYRILKRERIALLHTNNSLARDSMSILAGVLARVPVVAHERQLAPCSLFARVVSRRVKTLICISDAVLEFTKTSGARTVDRRRIYNAIDVAALRAIRPALPPGPLRVGIVGRIMPKKGQRFFLEAAAIVREKFPETEFYIVGQATGEDRSYEEEILALSRRLGLEAFVKWTGYLEEPFALMASLTVVVHAAIDPEPFGRVIIEAMALGRAVVATVLGGPAEIIEDGQSGFLVPPGDGRAIAEKIVALLEDQELAARVAAGALRRVEAFGVASYIRQVECAYADALRDSPHRLPYPKDEGSTNSKHSSCLPHE